MTFAEIAKRDYEIISKNIDKEKPVAPDDLETVIVSISQGLNVIEPIGIILTENTCWYDASPEQLARESLAPLNQKMRLKGVLLELVSTITLYDMYTNMFATINKFDRLRRYINHGDSGYGLESNRLETITERILDIENLAIVRENVQKYKEMRNIISSAALTDDRITYLDMVITGSRSHKVFSDMPLSDFIAYRNTARSVSYN